ncbi:MAG: twin-arginine translocation signal domain-containing protein [Kofleriaceae bacterium]|nr:twin-arginine translocation signal domain-containing protein [Myxococcales bacterium]MCB9559849.1 twin-arginine translocation signal domain-containing protein [Kofleriaceae bacterium]MCB9571461.1 twin-arginine translocation signal domain-containing protein [Kofleriaceae bacterium]
MTLSRRKFLGGLGAATAAAAIAPLVRTRRAWGGGNATRRIVIVGIGGGLRTREALGMAEGATMPNLFGRVPLIGGFGSGDAGDPVIAPEYAAAAPALVLPPPRATPLHADGALVTNLRYAEGPPGHLQGHACLVSGAYNQLENRADARLPVPTIFELHRKAAGAPATDAWYLNVPGGFYRALSSSGAPGYGPTYAGAYLSPPALLSPLVSIAATGVRDLDVSNGFTLPTIPRDPAEDAAARGLTAVLDGNFPRYPADGVTVRADEADVAAIHDHLAEIFADPTYQAFFPDAFGIGVRADDGGVDATADALTVFHAERVLAKFQPSVLALTLLDIDACHDSFNGYLRGQQIADACVAHLWRFIQSTDGLRDETTMIVLPEHGRHLFGNGQHPDSYGRSGIDHGQGDDGDRDVWMLALGPDVAAGTVVAPTGVTQSGRSSGRYETIDAVMTAMTLLGHGDVMASELALGGARPGLVIEEVLR